MSYSIIGDIPNIHNFNKICRSCLMDGKQLHSLTPNLHLSTEQRTVTNVYEYLTSIKVI